jgi:hypothetical protein
MELLKEAFIEGYKQRAESSDLIFDNASRMYAISLFDKWKSEQLLLHVVSNTKGKLLCEDCNKADRHLMFRVCEPCLINGKYIAK